MQCIVDAEEQRSMKHIWFVFAITLTCFLIHPQGDVFAAEKEAGATASFSANTNVSYTLDPRVKKLNSYLTAKHVPLADSAEHFIAEADRLHMDWKLVVAISGVESYFGTHIPFNSYNAWGWAVFTGNTDGRHFESWNDGITTVSEGLKQNYIDHGRTTVEQIGRIYAADPGWSWKVNHFIDEIENFKPTKPDQLAVML